MYPLHIKCWNKKKGKLRGCWWVLPKTMGAIAVAVSRTMLNQQNLGISRRVGGQVLYAVCDYLVWLRCHHQMLDFSSSRLLHVLTPMGASRLTLPSSSQNPKKCQSCTTWAPVPRCCWSAGLLEGCIGQILWLPLGTLIGIGFSLEDRKRIIS